MLVISVFDAFDYVSHTEPLAVGKVITTPCRSASVFYLLLLLQSFLLLLSCLLFGILACLFCSFGGTHLLRFRSLGSSSLIRFCSLCNTQLLRLSSLLGLYGGCRSVSLLI